MERFSFEDVNKYTISKNRLKPIQENNNFRDDIIVENLNKNDIVTENTLISKKNSYLNFDKFEKGTCNFCLITGIGSSGKTTLAKKLAKEYNAIHVELDIFYTAARKYKNLNELKKKTNIILYDYYSKNKKVYERIKNNKFIPQDLYSKSEEFILYAIKYAKNHKKDKFIIEGNELYTYGNTSFKKYPFIFINTSVAKAEFRSYKKEKKHIDQYWKYLPSMVSNSKHSDKTMNEYKKKLLKENSEILLEADDDLGPTDYTADDLGGGDDVAAVGGGDEDLGPTDYNDDSGDDMTDTTDDTSDDTTDTDDSGDDDLTTDDEGGDDLDSLESDTDDPTTEPSGDGTDVENSNDEQMNNEDQNKDNENNKFLIKDYLELYNRMEEILEKINSNEKFKFSRDVVYNKARLNIEKIRDMLFDYITQRFNKESYVSNLYHFNLVIQAININIAMIGKSPTIAEINERNKEKENKYKKNEKSKRSK